MTMKKPESLSLSRDVEDKARRLLIHAIAFRDDWRNGDFDLPDLARRGMERMEAQFGPLLDAMEQKDE